MLQTIDTILTSLANLYFILPVLIVILFILHVAAFQRKQTLTRLAEELHLNVHFDYWVLRPFYRLAGDYKHHAVLIYDVPSGGVTATKIVVDNTLRRKVWPVGGDTFIKRLKFSVLGSSRFSSFYVSPELIKRELDALVSEQ